MTAVNIGMCEFLKNFFFVTVCGQYDEVKRSIEVNNITFECCLTFDSFRKADDICGVIFTHDIIL